MQFKFLLQHYVTPAQTTKLIPHQNKNFGPPSPAKTLLKILTAPAPPPPSMPCVVKCNYTVRERKTLNIAGTQHSPELMFRSRLLFTRKPNFSSPDVTVCACKT